MARRKRRDILFFGMGIFAGLAAVYGSLSAIGVAVANLAPQSMPAPAISSLVHLDEKLRFIRQRPDLKPTLLAVGSSITWRQLDGSEFANVAGGADRFLNGATAHLRIHQSRAMANFLLDHYKSVDTLLVMVSLPDFEDCRSEPAHLFQPEDAARYAFGNWPAAYFYFHYVSPMRYVRGAMNLAERRTPVTGDLYLDIYGSGPLNVPEAMERGLRYPAIDTDVACREALGEFVREMDARGIRMLLVFSPVHPDYRARHPRSMEQLADVVRFARHEVTTRQLDVGVLNLTRDAAFESKDFFDAFHLEWAAPRRRSADIAGAMERRMASRGIGPIPIKVKADTSSIRIGSTRHPQ